MTLDRYGDPLEDDDATTEQTASHTAAGATGKWLPEPDCIDAWGNANSGEPCPHGLIGGLDVSRLGHARCIDCGGRRHKFKKRLTGRHPLNLDKITGAQTREAA